MRQIILFYFISIQCIFAQLLSPKQYIPSYENQVTFYNEVENYFGYLCKNSTQIKHIPYGKTYQGRNLNAYIVTSNNNLNQLEKIRLAHLSQTGLVNETTNKSEKAIVWLSFNVHGNEIGAIESAMQITYELLNNTEYQSWLNDLIIIIDPCLNPDGFSRYANWLRDVSHKNTHPSLSDREHMEPWPGGRQNHYIYDLNRDWAWQTQIETQQRIALYHLWMPQVHVDVHEMGFNEPYFFPPAAEPYHEQITPYQREFHKKIGEITSKKFDKEGWLYYSGERFDLFYPSYGDTYPSYNGAIGMTYEQGGIGAGRAVTLKNGDVLTIKDRIEHHTKAVLAAVELSYLEKNNLNKNFFTFFKESRSNPKSKFKTYIIKKNEKNKQLVELLQKNRIEYFYANEKLNTRGWHYQTAKETSFTIEPNDLIISVNQPKAVLTQVLFEPNSKLSDSLSYDITAWSLPFAYGVETYGLKNFTTIKTKPLLEKTEILFSNNFYAIYIPWNGTHSAKILSAFIKKNGKVRMVKKASIVNDIALQLGGLIITKADNKHLIEFDKVIKELIQEKDDVKILPSGFANGGGDLGGENYPLLQAPKILLLAGKEVSNIDFGMVWYHIDNVLQYPLSVVDIQYFNRISWSDYTTLILPDGYYSFTESQRKTIDDFVFKGGKIIAMNGALQLFEDKQGYNLTPFATEEEKELAKKEADQAQLSERFLNYEGIERRFMSALIPGAIIENVIDTTHPLCYGLGTKYFSLKTSERYYKPLKNALNPIYVPKDYKSYGFIGSKLKSKLEETATFSIDYVGNGKVIYMVDNPLFRGFWENGNLLFSNALFLVE